jgi:hypothetical protein
MIYYIDSGGIKKDDQLFDLKQSSLLTKLRVFNSLVKQGLSKDLILKSLNLKLSEVKE